MPIMTPDPESRGIDISDWDLEVGEPLKAPLLQILQDALIASMSGEDFAPDVDLWCEAEGPEILLWLRGITEDCWRIPLATVMSEGLQSGPLFHCSGTMHPEDKNEALAGLDRYIATLEAALLSASERRRYIAAMEPL